ncbi:MAG: heavy-metal-associated domain-containing protein [Chloroflexi bacterium]|nr:heavy-metal-associated domain-containing protein [Chloroflexota bacterium]
MTQPMLWATLWVDSIDRREWPKRVKQALNLDGVAQINSDLRSGKVRVRYDPNRVTIFQLSAHLRSAGL